jgi:hypothetical protein
MRLTVRPALRAGGPAGRSSGMWMAGVLAGLAAARPAGTGPQPAAPHAAPAEDGAGR